MGSEAFIPDVSDWLRRGTFVTVGDEQKWSMFVQEFGDSSASPQSTALLLHGFPESSFSFNRVLDGLLRVFDRVVAPDFLGFGFSDKPDDHPNSILQQVDLLEVVFADLQLKGAHIIAHDMGDAAACEILARQNEGSSTFSVFSLTLTNGPLVQERTDPGLNIRLLRSIRFSGLAVRLAARPLFGPQVHRANGTKNISKADIMHMWEILAVSGGHRQVHLLIQYLDECDDLQDPRWLPALTKAGEQDVPIRLVWGDADRVSPVEIAKNVQEQYCPSASLRVIRNGGHFLQLDSPEEWLGAVLPPFLKRS